MVSVEAYLVVFETGVVQTYLLYLNNWQSLLTYTVIFCLIFSFIFYSGVAAGEGGMRVGNKKKVRPYKI